MERTDYIETRDDVIQNIKTLYSYLEGEDDDSCQWAANIIKNGRNYVVEIIDNHICFAPSRFAGYKDNTKDKHQQSPGNGTQTDNVLKFFYRKVQDDRLDDVLQKELARFALLAGSKKYWKYWIPKGLTIEEILSASGSNKVMFITKTAKLLLVNHNLILTGAPGTGKTYMAKEMAAQIMFGKNYEDLSDEEQKSIGFVQFHPSYDYTDFVEGLRPIESGNGFNRRNGIFKDFCADALQNLNDSKKTLQALKQETSVRGILDDFLEESIEQESTYFTSGTKNEFHIVENKERSIIIEVPANEKVKTLALPKSDLITLMENEAEITGGKDIQQYFHRKYRTQQDSYTYVLYGLLRKRKAKKNEVEVSLIPEKKFVFIIDEINRGEISKIFGELFFSIDPGYRGKKGLVQTQYQNMIEPDDVFKEGFYVPENVYIIGTMNDIDRSVESMDFAMRRRFAWKEVTAEESYEAMKDLMTNSEEVRQRMFALNDEIAKNPGLNKSYQIGAAYFLKLDEYDGDFDKLWEYHLKGLLYEYLRGNRDADEQLKKLESAYKGTSESAVE